MNHSHICRLFFAVSESIEIYLSLHICVTIRGLPRWQSGKETACQCRRHKRTWAWAMSQEDSPREGNGNLLQYSCLKNPMDRGAWRATVQGAAKSGTRLSTHTHFTIGLWPIEGRNDFCVPVSKSSLAGDNFLKADYKRNWKIVMFNNLVQSSILF